MNKHCCEVMAYHANFECEVHEDPYECPDRLLVFDTVDHEYGLIIHDGGTSTISIDYCPWCGRKLVKRDESYKNTGG